MSSNTQFYVKQGGTIALLDAAAFATQILAKVPGGTTIAPGVVTSLAAGTPSSSAVPLTWVAPATGTAPIVYQVQYRQSGTSNWIEWGGTTSSLAATVSGLNAATSYDFSVIASNSAGSATSATVTVSTAYIAPGAPTGVTTSNATSTSMSLAWTAPTTGTAPITYQPQYQVAGGTSWTNFGALLTATSVTITGLQPSTSYNFRVTAQNGGGSTVSATVSASTTTAAVVVPGAATGLTVTSATQSTLPLSWTAPTVGTTPFTYQVNYRVTGTTSWIAFGGQITGTSETITGLAASTSYDLQVQTINSAGTSVSATLTSETSAAPVVTSGVSGSQNTGTTAPVIAGPASGTVTTSGVLDVTGITLTDAFASGNAGSCSLNIACSLGTLSATAGGSAVTGSGTSAITYNNSFANCQAAVASLVYTAPSGPGADTITVNLYDQSGAANTLSIPVTINTPASGTGTGGGTSTIPSDATGTTASRIADMMERFGVVTFSSTSATANVWGSYPADYTPSTVIAAMNAVTGSSGMIMNAREYHYAGREQTTSGSSQSTWCPAVHNGTGAMFTMCVGQGGSNTDVATMVSLAQASATGSNPWMAWLEGINEPNGVAPVAESVTQEAQSDIWTGVSGLAGISVMGPSLVVGLPVPDGYITDYATTSAEIAAFNAESTIVNVHFYPPSLPSLDDGSNRNGAMEDVWIGEHNGWSNTYPEIITEWHPTYYNSNEALVFDDAYNGYYSPIFILEAFRAGFTGYFWFSLFDFASTACGLFAQSAVGAPTVNTPRNGALAIQAMYQLSGPAGASKHTFTPGKLDYTATGLPAVINAASPYTGGQTMLFQNDAGTYLLFVWNAQINPGGTPVNVEITFGEAHTKIVDYDITNAGSNMTALQTVTDASSITVSLSAAVHLLVIDF